MIRFAIAAWLLIALVPASSEAQQRRNFSPRPGPRNGQLIRNLQPRRIVAAARQPGPPIRRVNAVLGAVKQIPGAAAPIGKVQAIANRLPAPLPKILQNLPAPLPKILQNLPAPVPRLLGVR